MSCANPHAVELRDAFKHKHDDIYCNQGDRGCSQAERIRVVHNHVRIFSIAYRHLILAGTSGSIPKIFFNAKFIYFAFSFLKP